MNIPKVSKPRWRALSLGAVFLISSVAMLALREAPPTYDVAPTVAEEVAAPREPAPPSPMPSPAPRVPASTGGPPAYDVVCPGLEAPAPTGEGTGGSFTAAAYQGLGAWVDIYDYAVRGCLDPAWAVSEMNARGVKTIYLQTSRWKQPQDIVWTPAIDIFLEHAHLRGMKVVGWYLPGFGDLERDIRRSLAVINYRSPHGHRFDGFAADIESRQELNNSLEAFNAGISEYSRRLRASVPKEMVLGGIVVDAKNNERAPGRWIGFPWPDIAANYDVVLPMTYWSVTKGGAPACLTAQMDAKQYILEAAAKTTALMGTTEKSMHFIGGIADCVTEAEVAGYVDGAKAVGSLGVSLYDFDVTQSNPSGPALWQILSAPR